MGMQTLYRRRQKTDTEMKAMNCLPVLAQIKTMASVQKNSSDLYILAGNSGDKD